MHQPHRKRALKGTKMLEDYGKIFAIILFAIVIYLVGHIVFWLISSFIFLEWTAFWPMHESHEKLRVLMATWIVVSLLMSKIFTK